jgi:potassium efflux system protein
MKLIVFAIFFLFVSQAAEIDKRFFSSETKSAFLEEVKKKIDENQDKDLALLESKLLNKITKFDEKDISAPLSKVELKDKEKVDIVLINTLIDEIVKAVALRHLAEDKISQVSDKRDYVKKLIEDITTENRDKLLSYQLQNILYQLIIKKEKTKLDGIEEYIGQSTAQVQNILTLLDTKKYNEQQEILDKDKGEIAFVQTQKSQINAELERETILDGKNIKQLTTKKDEISDRLLQTYHDTFRSVIRLSLFELAMNQKEPFYRSLKMADKYMDMISPDKQKNEMYYYEFVKLLGKEQFGTASMALMASKESLTDSSKYLWELLDKPLFVFNEKAVSSVGILKIVSVFVVGFFIASLYRRRFLSWSNKWERTTPMTVKLIANLGYYFIVFITLIVALSSIGLDLSSFSMFASALAIGIGFGLQTVVSNMVAGIILMFERSIRVGDLIEVTDTVKGTVTDIRIRSTVVKTFDNIDIVVPNSSFIQNNVVNLTLDDKTRRLHIPFGVAYGTEVKEVERAILSEVSQCDLNYYKGNDKEKKPLVRMVGLGNSSVDYELLVWIVWEPKLKPASLTSDFLILVYNALYKNNIEIPFPQVDLHVKDMVPLPQRLESKDES